MIVIDPGARGHRIDRRIYGQFAEHLGRGVYEGLWVGEDSAIPHRNGLRRDAVAALREIRVPVVRWPGGCFADEYHWLKGVGPAADRRPMVNFHWGGVTDPGAFGTHEYFELLHQLDAEAYVCGNVGSGTVAEMRDWVEYMTVDAGSEMAELRRRHGREQPWRLPFFGVGNESWGCGGHMTPLHYANQYRTYQTYVRAYGGDPVTRVACGANADDYTWTDVVMARAAEHMDALSLHYYTVPGGSDETRGRATGFDGAAWADTIERARAVDHLLTRHGEIMDRYDPQRRIGLYVDEWGTWFDPEPGTEPGFLYQQNTMRDAVVAAIHFHAFHRHAARVRMANIAQMVNVLQALLLTAGPAMVRTPTYHAFALYTDHQDAEHVPTGAAPGGIRERVDGRTEYTVSRKDGAYTLSAANTSLDAESDLAVELPAPVGDVLRANLLTGPAPDAHNTFEAPDTVRVTELTGLRVDGRRVRFTLPPHAVATVRVSQPAG